MTERLSSIDIPAKSYHNKSKQQKVWIIPALIILIVAGWYTLPGVEIGTEAAMVRS